MAQTSLLEVSEEDEPGYTPPGRYWCIDHLCVREQARGRGIGQHLVRMLFDTFVPYALDGSLLWYHIDNPLAAYFWPRLGYLPLWSTYQRRSRLTSS
jgi:GNAT superfamily N-acetyltransferase